MTDEAHDRRAADGQMSVQTTATTALSAAAAVPVAMWIFDMIDKLDFTVPPLPAASVLVAVAAPFGHIVGRGIRNRLTRWADKTA